VDLPYGDPKDTDVTVYEPFRADSTKFTDEKTVELAKRKQDLEREIDADLVTEEPERSDHIDRLVAETTVSAHESNDPTLSLDKLTACNDGISNDPQDDELVDAWEDENGDRFIDPDEGDPGCTSSDDDNEGHVTWTLSIGSGGDVTNKAYFVSSAEGHRELFWADTESTDFPVSIKDAILINSRVEVKVQNDQAGEEFAMEFACGPNNETKNKVNLTEVVEDQGRDGWVLARLRGITTAWFSEGTDCAKSYLHASKVRGEDPGDGNDDVFFLTKNDDTIRSFQIRWTIEEEDNHKTKSAGLAKHRTQKVCSDTRRGELCTNSELPERW
jgi:hypothetical protein